MSPVALSTVTPMASGPVALWVLRPLSRLIIPFLGK